MEFLLLFIVGIFIGTFGTMVGIGGGFIIVPLLLFVYSVAPQYAVGTSLAIITLNALSGTISYARQKRINLAIGISFAAATIPGAMLGASLLPYIPSRAFHIGFGIFLLLMASYMIIKPRRESAHSGGTIQIPHVSRSKLAAGIGISFFVGFLSSVGGIGGGIIHVPAMIYILHFPTSIAVPTSHFILLISTLFGASSHAYYGNILWSKVPSLGLGVIIGAQFGAYLSKRIHSSMIVRALAFAVIAVAVRMMVK